MEWFDWRLFQRFILRDVLKNRIRTGLTIMGIALGVAILLAIRLANHTAVEHFRDSLERVSGRSNLHVVATTQPAFDEALMRQLQWVWLVDGKMTPVIEQTAVLPSEDSEQAVEVIQVLGVDMMADFDFRSYEWTLAQSPDSFLEIFKPGAVFVGQRLAERQNLKMGDTLSLLINDRLRSFKVVGVLSGEGLGGAYGGALVSMDLATAQEVFAMTGQITRLELIIPEGAYSAVQDKLRQDLPGQVSAQRPERRGTQVEKMLRAYQYNLTVLSFIALLVGMFLIYNTMSISVIRRRSEIGTMRALGVSRRQIFALFLFEAVLLGLVGTGLGVLFGMGLATGAVEAVSTTVQTLYTGQPVEGLSFSGWELLLAGVFGLTITLLGAMAPVFEAASIPPAEALRRASYESKVQRFSTRIAGLGVGVLLLALWAAFQPPIENLPLFGFVSALFVILGSAFLMPFLLDQGLLRLAPLFKRLLHTEGYLSALSLRGALGRTSVAVASLMVGIAMMVSLAVMIGSFRQTVATWVNQTLRADLWIEPAGRVSSRLTTRLSPEVVEAIRNLPGVQAVDAFYEFPVEYQGMPANIAVGDFDVLAEYGYLHFLNDVPVSQVLPRALEAPAVVVTESFARKQDIWQGEMIHLETPAGPVEFRVEGVYYDYASDQGYIVMPRQWYRRFYKENPATGLAVYLEPAVDTETIRAAIYRAVGKEVRLSVETNRELRDEVLRIFDNTFAITYALHVIAIIVAILAVMNALFALVMESRREFGILKYLGASRQQIIRMVLIEAGLLGVLGNLTGLVVGFLLSFLLIYVINRQSFGWTIQLALPAEFLVQSFMLVLGAAILSGLIPARLASQTLAPEVVREE